MAGLFTYSITGVAFLLVAALETLTTLRPHHRLQLPLNLPLLRHVIVLLLSSLFLLYQLTSALASSSSSSSSSSGGDPIGSPLPLSSSAAASLFLLHSLCGLLHPLLSPLLPLLSAAAFFLELLLFRLRRHDLDGVENRYFDLLLVPILVCLSSTLLSIARPRSRPPLLARAAGLALHGTWLIQTGFSVFSSAIAHGCFLHRRSWGNYTVRCKGHPEYHRARAIATLQFNCHLALMVVVAVGVYAMVVNLKGGGGGGGGERRGYRALSKEMRSLGNGDDEARFTLDSDEDEVKNGDVAVPVSDMGNGYGH